MKQIDSCINVRSIVMSCRSVFAVVAFTFAIFFTQFAEESDAGLDLSDPTQFIRTGVVTNSGSLSFNRVRIYTYHSESANWDEFRIGTTYDSVAPLAPSVGMLIVVQ